MKKWCLVVMLSLVLGACSKNIKDSDDVENPDNVFRWTEVSYDDTTKELTAEVRLLENFLFGDMIRVVPPSKLTFDGKEMKEIEKELEDGNILYYETRRNEKSLKDSYDLEWIFDANRSYVDTIVMPTPVEIAEPRNRATHSKAQDLVVQMGNPDATAPVYIEVSLKKENEAAQEPRDFEVEEGTVTIPAKFFTEVPAGTTLLLRAVHPRIGGEERGVWTSKYRSEFVTLTIEN